MTIRSRRLQQLLGTTVAASAFFAASPAFAQVTDQPGNQTVEPATEQTLQQQSEDTVVVTGTLISNPNLVSSSPVSVIGEDEIQLRQSNNAEQILRELPGVTPNLGQNVNNGTVGSARVDLRGLGANRNLVLLDGVRLTPSSFSGIVDLNNIPLALIQRVDVLTGGASTTYGADAVSGVVNFITRRDFAGVNLDVSQQISERGDGNVFRADLAIGANFDDGRGNAVFAVGYQEADPVYFGDREFSQFTVSSSTGVASGDSFTSVPTGFSFSDDLQIDPTGTRLVPFYNAFNFNPFNIFVTPFERFNMYGSARYEVSDSVEVYARGLFSKNSVSSIIAASGIFGVGGLQVRADNPFLAQRPLIRDELCRQNNITAANCTGATLIGLGSVYRRSTELGPRISEYVTTFFDYQAGLRYNISDSIQFDLYGSYGESENVETRSGYVALSRVTQALDAVSTTQCRNTANGCVPLDLFGPEGSITPAAGAFIGGVTSSITNATSLAQVHGVINGDIGYALPWAAEPIAFAVGGEYREYRAERRPDNLASVPGELGGAGGATLPLNGGFDVYEAFAEVIAPIVADRPFFNELTLEAGVRYSQYSIDAANSPQFDTTTYKVGLTWEPDPAIRFRGNYQQAVRAPNIGELFAPVVTGLTNLLVDPCAGAAPTTNANLRAICIAQGAPASSIGSIQNPSAGQANVTGGGNPNIRPETAITYTLGMVLRPTRFIPNFTLSLDYYNIEVEDAITAAAPGDIIEACFGNITAASAADPACTSIQRNRTNGRLSGTSTAANPIPGLPGPLTNNGRLATDGFDLVASWNTDLGFARLNLYFAGNYTMSSEFQASPTSFARDCVGYYSTNCGISTGLTVGSLTPEFQWTQRTTLSFDHVDVSLLWRHIDAMHYEGSADDFADRGFTQANRRLYSGPITGRGALVGRNIDFNEIPAFDYFDLTARFGVTDNFDFTVSVFNLFDKQPPIVGSSAGSTSFNGGNTFPSTYDTVGRRFGASARLRF